MDSIYGSTYSDPRKSGFLGWGGGGGINEFNEF